MNQSPLPPPETLHAASERAAACARTIRHQRKRIGTELDLLRSLRLEARDRDWGSLPATLTEAIALIEAGHARLRTAAAWLDQRAASDAPLGREGGRDGN